MKTSFLSRHGWGATAGIVPLLLVLAMFGGGCSAFRAAFDEDPAVTQQKREQARQRRSERRRSGAEDGVFPSFFPESKRPDSLYVGSSLTPEERAVLEGSEAASKRRNRESVEIESIRRENREREEKASDQVFGGGWKDLFNP